MISFFSWSWPVQKRNFILVCDYGCKKSEVDRKWKKIIRVASYQSGFNGLKVREKFRNLPEIVLLPWTCGGKSCYFAQLRCPCLNTIFSPTYSYSHRVVWCGLQLAAALLSCKIPLNHINCNVCSWFYAPKTNSSKKVLQFKFDLLYVTLFSVFSTKIGIIRKLV